MRIALTIAAAAMMLPALATAQTTGSAGSAGGAMGSTGSGSTMSPATNGQDSTMSKPMKHSSDEAPRKEAIVVEIVVGAIKAMAG